MALTIKFIADNFVAFNKEYFDGKLEMPHFEITHVKSYLGQLHWKYDMFGEFMGFVIRISNMFDRSDKDIQQTLLHEMTHLYIRQNHIKDTRPHHGKVFNSIADRINKQGGWHIARTDSVDGCGLRNKEDKKEYFIVCYKIGNSDKYFQFAINKKYVDYYYKKFEKCPSHFKDVFVFRSTDDKTYAHFTQCYKSVRGYFISKQEFDHLRETTDIIVCSTTLGLKRKAA